MFFGRSEARRGTVDGIVERGCPMVDVIPDQLPWWVAGPGIGLCVVALYALANLKLGVSGGWLQLLLVLERRPMTEP